MSTVTQPMVVTDQADYAPLETATITATGFSNGSYLEFLVEILSAPGDDGLYGTADDVVDAEATALLAETPWIAQDGGDFDLDPAEGSVQTTWLVDPDALNTTLRLTVTNVGEDGVKGTADDEVAITSFTDGNPAITLNQWETITQQWANGQANPNQATYLEGDVLPVSTEAENLTVGTIYGIRINLDYYQANTDAGGFAYLDTFDRSFPGAIPPNFGDITPITKDGDGFTFNSNGLPNKAFDFHVDNADVLTVDYSLSANGLFLYADVTFTPTIANERDGEATSILYWGQRLSLPNEVQTPANPNGGTKGAAGFTGGSLQTKIEGTGTAVATWITPSNAVQLQPGVVVRGLISGFKWNDANANSQWESTELGLSGWTMNLWKDDGDGVFEPGAGDTLYSTTTTATGLVDINGDGTIDPLGYYEFSSAVQPDKPLLRNDTLFVTEAIQPGWHQTYPTSPNSVPNPTGSNYWGPFTITTLTPQFKGLQGAGSEDAANSVGNFGNYFKPLPGPEDLEIQKFVSCDNVKWDDADSPTGPKFLAGSTPTYFKFEITNNSATAIAENVTLSDSDFDLNGAADGGSILIPSIAPGATETVYYTGPFAILDQHTNTGRIDWLSTAGPSFDTDDANYFGAVLPTSRSTS